MELRVDELHALLDLREEVLHEGEVEGARCELLDDYGEDEQDGVDDLEGVSALQVSQLGGQQGGIRQREMSAV